MSFHKNPKYQMPELIQSLKDHGLKHDRPDQLADSFRIGWVAALAARVTAAPQEGVSEKDMDEVMKQRDYYHDVADDLASQIAAITGEDIGEHSSSNNPWQNAANAATEYRAQPLAVGVWENLNWREVAVWWEQGAKDWQELKDIIRRMINRAAPPDTGNVGAIPEGYAQRVIDALYENGDPVSVDAAELLTQMVAALPPPGRGMVPMTEEQRRKMLDRLGAQSEGMDGDTWDKLVITEVESFHGIKEGS